MAAQNFNSDLLRQMQQQLGPLAAQQHQNQALGSLQNGLSGLDANMLMSAFQAAPQAGQNAGQQGNFMDVQRAENILAAAFAAAGNNAQNQAPVGGQQPQQQQLSQPNAFMGLEGLGQLQAMNQQQGFQQQSWGGLQGLQQQLANLQQQLQQQLGQGQQPNQQQQLAQQAQPNQAGIPAWMGQNINASAFNPSALSLTGVVGGGGGQNNFQPDAFAGLQQFQQQNQQQQVLQRRSSSLSSGSMSPVGNKLKAVNAKARKGFGDMFPPNLAVSNGRKQPLKPPRKLKPRQEQKKKKAKSFPEKLMQAMMENSDEEAVAWLPDGKSFVIVNPDLFCDEVLSKVFKETKYASFVRKLHRWGFVRLTSGTGTDCFHHPQFQRNKKETSAKIICAVRAAKDSKDKPKERNPKPPSLAGVEKFIRAKVVAAAASAAANAEESLLLQAENGDISGDNNSTGEEEI